MNNIAIIVPFRDDRPEQKRSEQLASFMDYMTVYLAGEHIDIIIVEQSQDGRLFNRGALCNAGFSVTKYDYYIFHDVDLLPAPELKQYYTNVPEKGHAIHIAAGWTRYSGADFFGGIVAFRSDDFILTNGFPIDCWGWGMEDCILFKRTKAVGIEVVKPRAHIVDLEDLSLGQKLTYLKEAGLKNPLRKKMKQDHMKTWKTNGLSNLEFTVEQQSLCKCVIKFI